LCWERLVLGRRKSDTRAGKLVLGTGNGFLRAKAAFLLEFAAVISSAQTAARKGIE
jgi:hypothetical protein